MLLSRILSRRAIPLMVSQKTAITKMTPVVFSVQQQHIGETRAMAGTAQSQTSAVRFNIF
jgi:hypothetical protein